MSIAIQAADLDAERIDGTRVYLLRLLERFGAMFPDESWHLFHWRDFNPYLTPPAFPNYHIHTVPFPLSWTQTRFAWELFRQHPGRLFMPVQALPVFLPKGTQSIVTIHDLAFKLFPEHFPSQDVWKLNWLTDFAVRHATRLIAVSDSTKRDILKWYPHISESKIRVIYHGFDIPQEGSVSQDEKMAILEKFHLTDGEYILYVGALQPRKNLIRLMEAFAVFGRSHPSAKLVLAGEAAWMSTKIFEAREKNIFRDRIVMTERVSFEERSVLYKYARIFVYPSLYEGFGLPILEAFASGVPVVCANNSSLPEVAGDAAQFFDANRSGILADILSELWNDISQRTTLITAGREQLKKFSWNKCAQETAEWILE
ncbi:MAG: glycosyltransferase family 4 protein [Candidatus Moraniibacteriota bacterium]|nr:MAG: glycosyltransferase family 4 protein [Candidatus Moranbacteria bacterium]